MLIQKKVSSNTVALFDERNQQRSMEYASISSSTSQFRTTCLDHKFGIIKCVGNKVTEVFKPMFLKRPNLSELFFHGITIGKKDDGCYLIDADGNILYGPQPALYLLSDDQDNLLSDYIGIGDTNGHYGLHNLTTGYSSKVEYTDLDIFENYIKVWVDEKVGILGKKFQEILPPIYVNAVPFGEDAFIGITDQQKKVVKERHWKNPSMEVDEIFPKQNGFYRVRYSKYFAYVNAKTGDALTDFLFSEATDFNDFGVAFVRHCGKAKMITNKGEIVNRAKAKKIF